MSERKNVARDLKIVAAWNSGRTYSEISAIHACSRNAVSGAIRDARKRGEQIKQATRCFGGARGSSVAERAQRRQRHKSARPPAPARKRKPVTHTAESDAITTASNPAEYGAQLRAARKTWSSRTMNVRLPTSFKQCRWLKGDLLEGKIRACRRTRERKDLALADDRHPYCKTHRRQAAAQKKACSDAHMPRKRIVRSRYGFSYTATA